MPIYFQKCSKNQIVQNLKLWTVCICLFENSKDEWEFCLKNNCVDVDGRIGNMERRHRIVFTVADRQSMTMNFLNMNNFIFVWTYFETII